MIAFSSFQKSSTGATHLRSTYVLSAALFIGGVILSLGIFLAISQQEDSNREYAPTNSNPPNIVFVVMDAFRADRISMTRNGEPLTPFLNSLYQEGIVFENAITPCTWTRPAMSSIFTSLHVDTHQVYYGHSPIIEDRPLSDVLSEELPTLALYFKANGYHTLAVQTNGQLSPQFGFHRGFDSYVFLDDVPGETTTSNALALVENTDSPFLLYVHYMDPHLPYDPPQYYLDLLGYNLDGLSLEEAAIVEDFKEYLWDHANYVVGRTSVRKYETLSAAAKDCLITRYDAETRYCDAQVERLVTLIRQEYPDTIFIITADHGEHFWDHDFLGHGLTMYDCELRVPLFILGKAVVPKIITTPVNLVSIMPTLAGLLDFQQDANWQGYNLLAQDDVGRPVFSYTRGTSPGLNTDVEAVVFDGMKYINDMRRNTASLYSWLEEPYEKKDLLSEKPDVGEQMRQLLLEHRRDNLNARRTVHQQTTLDEETVEQLRRLGYME